jgi:Ca-activated chloride channel family protein
MMMKKRREWIGLMLAACLLTACGADGLSTAVEPGTGVDNVSTPSFNNGNLGATPGGAQDIEYARTLIEQGQIPPADSITVEGLLSQHDLPVTGEECEDLLCIRPGLGFAPNLETGEMEAWIQLGMVSGFKASEFERPPLDAVVVVDKSSAMSVDMDETNDAVTDIIDRLRRDDRIAIVTFDGSAKTLQEATPMTEVNVDDLKRRVRDVRAGGRSNLMEGLQRGYQIARGMGSGSDRMARVFVLSCGYPDTGSTDAGSFVDLVKKGADDGIGMSFFGVLLSFDHRLAERLSNERGGNYYYMGSLEQTRTIVEEEFDYAVTPLAYDLRFKLGIDTANYELAEVYGIPGEPGASEAAFDVKTAFISKRKGAMVARLEPKSDTLPKSVANVSFSYQPEPAHGWSDPVSDSSDVAHDGDVESSQFDGPGVRKTVALVNMAEQMKHAIETGDVQSLHDLRDYLETEANELNDPELLGEVELVEKLIALM